MKFLQYKDGSCDITFTDVEIDVIIKNKKLHLTSTSLRHFGNNLMNIVVELNDLLPEKDKIIETMSNEINTENDKNTK